MVNQKQPMKQISQLGEILRSVLEEKGSRALVYIDTTMSTGEKMRKYREKNRKHQYNCKQLVAKILRAAGGSIKPLSLDKALKGYADMPWYMRFEAKLNLHKLEQAVNDGTIRVDGEKAGKWTKYTLTTPEGLEFRLTGLTKRVGDDSLSTDNIDSKFNLPFVQPKGEVFKETWVEVKVSNDEGEDGLDFRVPQSVVNDPKIKLAKKELVNSEASNEEDDDEGYEWGILCDKYIDAIAAALSIKMKEIEPKLKLQNSDEGVIKFKVKGMLTPDQKQQIKQICVGVRKVTFDKL